MVPGLSPISTRLAAPTHAWLGVPGTGLLSELTWTEVESEQAPSLPVARRRRPYIEPGASRVRRPQRQDRGKVDREIQVTVQVEDARPEIGHKWNPTTAAAPSQPSCVLQGSGRACRCARAGGRCDTSRHLRSGAHRVHFDPARRSGPVHSGSRSGPKGRFARSGPPDSGVHRTSPRETTARRARRIARSGSARRRRWLYAVGVFAGGDGLRPSRCSRCTVETSETDVGPAVGCGARGSGHAQRRPRGSGSGAATDAQPASR
jgi:hypothetical protein